MPGFPHQKIAFGILILLGILTACESTDINKATHSPPSLLWTEDAPAESPTLPVSVSTETCPIPTRPSESQTALASPTPPFPNSIPTPSPEIGKKRTRYKLSACLDYALHYLSVEETVLYLNNTSSELSSIPLIIEPLRYPDAFHLTSLFWEDKSRITQYQLKDTKLTLFFPQPLAPGESTIFSLFFELQLPYTSKFANLRPYPFGYTNLQANLGDWYPFIPPFHSDTGWSIHQPGFYGEHLVYDVADFQVNVRLIGEQTNLVLAASAPSVLDGEWRRYHHPSARSFAWSASPHYQVITQTVEIPGGSSVDVVSYFFPFYEQAGESIANTITHALPLFSRLFEAPYVHPMLSAVQADFLDGMEYEGLFFLSRDFYNWYNGTEQDFLVSLAAHETAHQWFYGMVGNNQALEPWLDEALCTYSERIFYENFFPEALDWWWTYRINYYEPKGWVDTDIYNAPQVAGQYRFYRDAVYLNGALFLEELRTLMGDQAFFEALRSYLAKHLYRQGSAESFFEIFCQYAPKHSNQIFEKYFSEKPVCR